MKPLRVVVAICLLVATTALPDNIEDVKSLPQNSEPIVEAEDTKPQTRAERCTTCSGSSGTLNFGIKSPNEVLAAIQTLPGAEVHSQSSFEGCSSERGCAGIKVKDGRVIEKYGNVDSFKAAANADTANEFSYHAAGTFGNNVFQGGIPKEGPFWWMNENSPFKNAAAGGGSYEKFSKSSSSSFSSGGAGGGATGGGGSISGSIDLSGNPFLNGDFSKLASGFVGGATQGGSAGFSGSETAGNAYKPTGTGGGSYQSSFESSYSSSNKGGEIDVSKNPFLNGGFGNKFGQSGFQGQFQGGVQGAQSSSSTANRFSGSATQGYTGSSPSPFTAYNGGTNVNLIQNSHKTNEFDFEQQQQTQQNIDEAFQGTGNVHGHEHSGGDLQQTCAGQGYVCVHKAQCNNGVVNTNGAGILQARTTKQYCNTKTEICCRIEIATVPGSSGVGLQGTLGVGSATYSGSGSNQGGIFATNSGSNSFGASASGSSSGSNSFGSSGSSNTFGSTTRGSGSNGFESGAKGSFGSGSGTTNAFGSNSNGFSSTASGSFGSNTNSRGTTTSNFGSSGNSGTQGFGASGTFGSGNVGGTRGGSSSFESSSSTFESKGSFGNTGFNGNGNFGASGNAFNGGANFGSTVGPGLGSTSRNSGNDILVGTKKTQTNFIETDSFSAGSEANSFYRPGAVGSGLKPGIPYLPPESTNIVSSTVRPPTPTYLPPTSPRPIYTTSTSAPEYLPPDGVPTNTKEFRVPQPTTRGYSTGNIYLDEVRPTSPKPRPILPVMPSGCAAALKCTPIEYCTAEGVISNTTVILTKSQEEFRVPLTDCRDVASGIIGKCCRDPTYTDPWPTNQLGKWVPGVFGGNDGKYTPHVTGSTILTETRNPATEQIGYGTRRGGGFIKTQGGGIGTQGGGGYIETQGGGISQGGGGFIKTQGGGIGTQGGGGFIRTQGGGIGTQGGGGFIRTQGGGIGTQSGEGFIRTQGGGIDTRGGGFVETQGGGAYRRQEGQAIKQGFGFENEVSESILYRVFLERYASGSGQCGLLNGQKPYGNRNELEVDFAEIPWQAMVLLKTNKSLLCGGVITRPEVVITSAACVEGLEAKNVLIKGGEWKLGIDEEPLPFQIVQVKNILRHPFYRHGNLQNDVAILVLSENLRWAKNIYPICLPGYQETLDAYYNGAGECIVTGWGKQVLQANLAGSIMHSLNISLINPGECQTKISQDYPHLLEQYDQNSCACGLPTNPINNICKVDIGSALACTIGDGHYILRGIYSWDSGCQPGNQLAAFYKFDIEWYEWAIGQVENERFAQFSQRSGAQTQFSGQKGGQYTSGVKGGQISSGIKGQFGSNFGGEYKQFVSSKFSESHSSKEATGVDFAAQQQGPIQNTFSSSYSEKKVFQSEPKIYTYTTKPEVVTFTTKPEYFTYTTKPKLVTYTTKPQFITYETSGSGQNPQYVAPGVTFNPSFAEAIGTHEHNAQCKCNNGKK